MKSKKNVYFFGAGKAEGKAHMKEHLGGKGANLAEMTNIGIPVPAGLTISTEVCCYYYQNSNKFPSGIQAEVNKAVAKVEKVMGKKFGDSSDPLLFSVRSGARASMPGMMDTILNLGLNDQSVKGLAEVSGNERFAWDSYRRFLQMYGDVVMGVQPEGKDAHDPFEILLARKKKQKKAKEDNDLTTDDLKELVSEFKALIKKTTGRHFPTNPKDQLWGAIAAVFNSWMTDRAILYRQLEKIPDEWGTAVNVQAMVFGNAGDDCATGVAFTRDPSTGKNFFYGEFLVNAQGEDVVAGVRTPQPLTRGAAKGTGMMSLEQLMPKAYKELAAIRKKLEKHYKDMQDIEFTIQNEQLFMLQTRSGKRTGAAAIKIAVDMVSEKLIDKKTAVMRVSPDQLDQLLHPQFDPKAKKTVIATGLPASPGAAVGRVVFNADDAESWKAKGEDVLLVRIETSPEDIAGMVAANGILTSRGGMTSHAAVVARGMGKCCVAGCGDIDINYKSRTVKVSG
ncbi:MAG: pyruvate, phosphate dikinase, partial [Candidatus Lindowbacteria bacterium]|nr:pyruvate, phosphate dikinase [Candidatus Lindowbacteria bacterium]